jgi:hypothetical protein
VAADMGYGHQRAAYPLLYLSGGEIITLNNYPGISQREKNYWGESEHSYDRLSRFKKVPLIGRLAFGVMDHFQKIPPYYPFRDLSAKTIQQRYFLEAIEKGVGKNLMEKLSPTGLPFVTTFFVAACAAEYYNYPGDIYCLVCDSDAARAWAPIEPHQSRIKYLLPTRKLKRRFRMYGVKEENIIFTGFPLPSENVGGEKETILKADLAARLSRLDTEGFYRRTYAPLLADKFPALASGGKKPVTITFAVGGAGAQAEIGVALVKSLRELISAGDFAVNLVAGNRPEVRDYFLAEIKKLGLEKSAGVKIIFAPEKLAYFKKFNLCLRTTDILWTKPSELSFYCALGLPVIIAEPVGSQEDFNREWLINMGAGIDSLPAEYAHEWLPDLLKSGRLARAAMDGYLNAEAKGAYNIDKLIER